MGTYIILDLETTGLDASRDAIIEVAAVLIEDGQVLKEFESLVDPRMPISAETTNITGITEEMLSGAPTFFEIRGELQRMIGGHVIVGHNIGFDMGFLRAENVALTNDTIDTVQLASILYPNMGRFGLEFLARQLNLPLEEDGQSHRALSDVYLTAELLMALTERATQLDIGILSEIVEAGSRVGWTESIFFDDALRAAAKHAFGKGGSSPRNRQRFAPLFNPPVIDDKTPIPKERPEELDTQSIIDMFGENGNFARAFEHFEYRQQQVDMVYAVSEAFNTGQHILIEAGTGTGKSVGYLLPAAFWAALNGRRVVVSTNTINLQDQLIHKDIPEMQKVLPFEMRATVRKGQSNYLCTRLFQQLRQRGVSDAADMPLYARLLVWLPLTQTGDIGEITLRGFSERMTWSKMSAENDVCTPAICAQQRCPRYIAQRRAETAHVVIVNHALLLSDIANNNHILPQFFDLIVDEAHHLETAVTNGLSFEADRRFLETTLSSLTRSRSGLLDTITGRTNIVPPEFRLELDAAVRKVKESAELAEIRVREFFTTLGYFLQEFTSRRGNFAEQVRLTPSIRALPAFDEVVLSWDNLHRPLIEISKYLKKIGDEVVNMAESFEIDDVDLLIGDLASSLRGLLKTDESLDGIISLPEDDYIYWVEVFKDRLSLHAAPLHVGPLVEEHIFHSLETVVLTSATLRTAPLYSEEEPDFNYMKQRLHARDADELAVGSPFDYEGNALLYLVSDMPEPNQPGYQRFVEQAIIDTAATLEGRTLALFTSYKQLRETAAAITEPLRKLGISVLAQTQGASRQQLTEQFKDPNARAVLLGTRSFWEGVDIAGEALQAVLLVKIPFDVPSDPVFAARSETFDNSFFEYSIPEAILRWRQGFGRLIRRKTDEGVVIILDKRVMSKKYGEAFIHSLPECTTIRQPAARINELLIRWFKRQRTPER